MIGRLYLAACSLALAVAAPATAATTLVTYGYDLTAVRDGADNGTAGNSVSWTTKVNGQAITVTATAWNATMITSGSNRYKYQISSAYLGQFDGGLGVTSAPNDNLNYNDCGVGECNTHQVDNFGNTVNSSSIDFIRLTFSSAVTLGSITTNAYGAAGPDLNSIDFDDDFSYGKTGTTAMSNGLVVTSLSNIFSNSVNSNGSCNPGSDYICSDTSQINSASQATANSAAKDWYIGASISSNYGGDGQVDAFKLSGVSAYAIQSSVPEPGTWAMMIIGFGAIGNAMRIRRRERQDARGF